MTRKQWIKQMDEQWEETDHYIIWRNWVIDMVDKINEKVIDDMIGKEINVLAGAKAREVMEDALWGYSQKVQELKEYKKEFNK